MDFARSVNSANLCSAFGLAPWQAYAIMPRASGSISGTLATGQLRMRCPFCQHPESDVIDTRKLNGGETIRRRRKCASCNKRFTTYERVESVSLTVVIKNGERMPYDREKLMRGVRTACYRRLVSAQQLESFANDVEAALMALDEQEAPSSAIGDIVMQHLREL